MGERVQVPAYRVQNSVSRACHVDYKVWCSFDPLTPHCQGIYCACVFPSILSSQQFHVGSREQHCQCVLLSTRHKPELMF